jgi:hypothetical protein
MPIEFYKQLYQHHLNLYQRRRFTAQSAMFNLELANLYSSKLIELGEMTKQEHQDNLLPIVDFTELMGKKGSLAHDGEE